MFVKNQKVICIANWDSYNLYLDKVYEVLDISGSEGIKINNDKGVYFKKERFRSIIQSIEDVIVGMELTHKFRGKVIVKSWDSEDNDIGYLHKGTAWFCKDLKQFKEYKPKQEEVMCKKEYKVIKSFKLCDIYNERPKMACYCIMKDEFEAMFEKILEELHSQYNIRFETIHHIKNYSKTLYKNLPWLEQQGFIEEVVKDVVLVGGVKLKTQGASAYWTVIDTQQGMFYLSDGVKLFCYDGLLKIPRTLEELNDLRGVKHNSTFEVVDEKGL